MPIAGYKETSLSHERVMYAQGQLDTVLGEIDTR